MVIVPGLNDRDVLEASLADLWAIRGIGHQCLRSSGRSDAVSAHLPGTPMSDEHAARTSRPRAVGRTRAPGARRDMGVRLR